MAGKHLKNGAKKNNLKVVLNLVIVAVVLVMLICSISAFAKFVIKQDNEISLFFRKVVLEIEVDYSEMLSDEHLIASIPTEEKLNIQYKIDDGEWQDYSEQLYIVEDCTIYARLTDGTTVYKETEQEILMPVACTKIGDAETYHTTVQNAINIAGTNEATVILLKDNIIDTLTIAEGQNITLDLNNHTLKSTNGSIVASYGDFTVTGEGTLAGEVYLDYSTVPEAGVPMVVLSTDGAAIKNLGDGTVKILSGTVKTFGKYVIAGQGTIIIGNEDDEVGAGPDVNGIIEVSADVYVHSGQITSKETAISSDKNITITGGTITGEKYGVSTTSGTLTIGNNDDTVSTTAPSITGLVGGIKVGDNATLDFYDGIITGPTDNSIEGNVTNTPNGYNVQKTNDGTNQTAILVSSNYVEYNGDTIINYYSTLQEAFTGAVSGNTIKPLKDLTDESTADIELAEGKNVILDLNGFKILTVQRIENSGTLEIKDNVGNGIYQSNTVIPIHNINSGSFTLTSGTIKKTTSTNAQAVVHNVGNSVFTMNGGKIESDVHGIVNADTAEIVINAGTINAQLNAIRDNSIAGVDENNPSIVINGGTITSVRNALVIGGIANSNAAAIVQGGELTTTGGYPTVLNRGNGLIIIDKQAQIGGNYQNGIVSNGYLYSSTGEYSTGTIEIRGGTITAPGTAIYNEELGTINISGGTINAGLYGVLNYKTGTINVTGGNITGAWGVRNNNEAGTINVSGGTITATEKAAIGTYKGTAVITGGNIIGATYGVYTTAGTTTITGGTINAVGGYLDSGEEAGIGAYIGKGLIVEGGEDIIAGTLTIGSWAEGDIDAPSTTIPSVQGVTEGVRRESGTFNFYDGVLNGSENNAIRGTVAQIPTGYAVQITNNEGIETAILVEANYAEYNGNTVVNYFGTLKDALAGVTSGNTIKPLKDVTDASTQDMVLSEGKNVTLDLNGYTVSTTQRVVNYGELEITDTTVARTLIRTALSSSQTAIYNVSNGILTVNGGAIESAGHAIVNSGNGKVIINNGTIQADLNAIRDDSTFGVDENNPSIVINGGTFTSVRNVLVAAGNSAVIVQGGELTTTGEYPTVLNRANGLLIIDKQAQIGGNYKSGLVSNGYLYPSTGAYATGTLEIRGGTITAPGTAIYNEELGTINISGGTITTVSQAVMNYRDGNINVTGGNITGAVGVRNGDSSNGIITVSGGTITATEKVGVGAYKGTAIVTGGNITGATYGVYATAGTAVITGGTIKATGGYLDTGEAAGSGAYIGKGFITEGSEDIIAGTLTIGSWTEGDTDSPSTTVPSIEGSIEGVRHESGTFNFYDGVLIGLENKAIIGGVTQTPASYTVNKVNDGTKQTATLVYAVATTTIGNTTTSYTTIQAAIDAAGTSEATVDLLYSGSRSEILTIEAGQNITLNMNGATITSAKNTITNRGNLTITGDGKIEGTGTAYTMILLREGAELTVENGTLDAAYRAIQVYANATLNIGEDDATVNETVPLIIGKSSYGIYMSSDTESIINFYDGIVKGAAGQSISGPISRTPDGYDVTNGSETIENVEYETAYLISIDAVAKTEINKSVSYYETVQEAINAAGTNEGARVTLLSNNISEGVTVAENQNIILNLNGKKLTYAKASTINNLGTLRIIGDGIVEGTGATLIHTITNDGTLIKDGKGELKATNTGNNYVVDNNATGTFIMNDGTITSNDRGLYNSTATGANGCIVINGGTINAVDYGIYNDSAATDENSPAVKITAGEITSSTEVGIYAVKAGRIEIGNATIVGNTYGIHSESTGTIIIDGANITGENNWGIYNEASGKITIYDGYIVGNGHGVGASTGSKGQLNVYGGTLKGLVSDGLVTGACTVTIGIDDGNVSQTTPHIEGYRYGLNKNSTSAKVYYNDGIIISNSSSAITGTITGTATGYVVNTVTNETGGKTATLIANYGEYDAQGNFVNAYSTLATATAGVTSGNTIKVLRTLSETTAPSVPAGTTVKLDMNDQTTTLTGVTLTNNGTLQIIGDGEIVNTKSNTIKNNGTLTVEEGVTITGVTTYVSGATGAQSTIDNYGTVTLNGGTIIAKSADGIFNESTGKIRINDGTITAGMAILRNFGTASTEEDPSVLISGGTLTAQKANGITNKSSGLLYITGGTITSNQTEDKPALYNETGKVKITGGTITSKNDRGVCNYYEDGHIEITGGTIIGVNAIQNKGTMVITGGVARTTSGTAVLNDGTLIIGIDDGIVTTDFPDIFGLVYGITNTSNLYFYDGIIGGASTKAINGTVTGTADGYNVVTGTKVVDDVEYNTSYLSNT